MPLQPAGFGGRVSVVRAVARLIAIVNLAACGAVGPAASQESGPLPSGEDIATEFVENFSRLDPIYFVAGADPANAKFQISFKYRLFGTDEARDRSWQWLDGVHLGYSQTSFWDLAAPSAPFRDSIFRPSLIYEFSADDLPQFPGIPFSYLRLGAEHESNGKDGASTRSLNTLYVEPNLVFDIGDDWHAVLNARAWAYVGSLSENPDIQNFRGNLSVGAGLMEHRGFGVMARLTGHPGTGHGSFQTDLTYALSDLIGLDMYFTAQFFTGYGESLLNYNARDTRLRFGLSIIR